TRRGSQEKQMDFPCVFPFTYKLRLYTACTTDHEASGRAWCATTANFDQDKLWRYWKEPGNAPCVFPFTYQNKDYTECTEAGEGKGKLWCATSHNYDKDKKKRYCFTYGGSSRGQPCVFPFSFKGHVHITCPQDENKVYWCATTSDYDRDRLWSYCPDTMGYRWLVAPRGNNPTDLCVFPFLFGGKNYTSCNRDREGKLWCATTFNFDKDQKRKDCSVRGVGGGEGAGGWVGGQGEGSWKLPGKDITHATHTHSPVNNCGPY
uniref:Fibronectin type-II domain-containing protein n=1 Tax=Ornithorhynchus anatinus TaxID=9258 RepID=A0A6I8NHE2_ORNAN